MELLPLISGVLVLGTIVMIVMNREANRPPMGGRLPGVKPEWYSETPPPPPNEDEVAKMRRRREKGVNGEA